MNRRRQAGQAAVETAIVMPLFVFIILGTLQLALMHQARLITKYAAYKAARAGALGNAKSSRMEKAALAVVVPLISRDVGGIEMVHKTTNASEYLLSWVKVSLLNRHTSGLKIIDVKVCGPTKSMVSGMKGAAGDIDFDNPENFGVRSQKNRPSDWKRFDATKLAVQVTFNYRMPIPFANMMLFNIYMQQVTEEVLAVTRTGPDSAAGGFGGYSTAKSGIEDFFLYQAGKSQGIYIIPIRESWAMRMQSNLFPNQSGYELPATNNCKIRFPRGGSSGGGGDDP